MEPTDTEFQERLAPGALAAVALLLLLVLGICSGLYFIFR